MTAKMLFSTFLIATIVVLVTGDKNSYDGHSSVLLNIETTSFISSESGKNLHLVFQPNMLDFEDLSVGDAESETVIVFNEHANKSVYFGSISGNVPDFYSSFFEEKVIPPMGNTTFNVVFLPRQVGMVKTDLLIHTSFGAFNYTVKGRGVECMFRLNPLVGLRAPLNATIIPEIVMYNPYDTPLQIVEVYSSGGQFQLELPGGSSEGPQALWQIPPFSSKPIIRVRFIATQPGNHSAYVRIKVSAENNSELEDVVLVVPIEVEIYNQYGIYSEIPILNFGLGGTEDKPKKLVLELLNSGKELVNIQKYAVEGDSDVASGVLLSIEPGTDNSRHIHSTITASVDWSAVKTEKHFRGNIIVTTYHKDVYRIPFVGEIIKGSIYFNESNTKFVTTNKDSKVSKDFLLKNNFEISLAITNVTLPDDCAMYFETSGFTPKKLEPGEESILFKLSLLNSVATSKHLLLHTNVNTYKIPVSSYNGLLRRIVPVDETTINGVGADEKSINFGTLQLSTLSDTVLAFVNDNPVPITIHNWTGTISGVASIYVILRGCGNLTMENLKFCYFIQPGEWIVFQVSVLSNAVGTFIGKLTVKTDYEELSTPIKFSTAMGRLEFTANMLEESMCFPGGTCKVNLTAFSTFNIPMAVEQILVNVSGTTYDYVNQQFPAIASNKLTHIGQLKFNPKTICGDDCYLEFPDRWPPAVISTNCRKMKEDLMSSKLEAFRAMKQSFAAVQFRVQTSQVRRFDFNSSTNLQWPQLVESTVVFPVSISGQELIYNVTINNPSNETIKAYYMLHDVANNGQSMTYPPEIISHCWDCFLTRENVFTFADAKHKNQNFDYIAPGSSSKIPIRFAAETPGRYETLFYIRNNFTVLEAIWLTAKAGVYQFKFGNRKPGSTTPLLFELSDKHLRDCDREPTPDSPPIVVTAKRTFTARNTGDIPIKIESMYVGGQQCEGFGFRIIQCRPFELQPNGSAKIEIAFTPDFTLTRVTQLLTLKTSLDYPVNYTLLSMIPGQALSACSKALQRPVWERSLQLMLLVVLGISFFLVIFVAFLDSDKVLKDHVNNMSKDKGPVQPTLDLRQIGLETVTLDDVKIPSPTTTSKSNGVAYLRKKQEKKRNETDVPNKKTWAEVLTKRFSPIQSDVKFKEDASPPQPIRPVESKREKQKTNREPEPNESVKLIEDDSSSTTTENSQQSSSDSSNDSKKSTPSSSKKTNFVVDSQPETKTTSKSKMFVKKSKSLPTSNVNNKEPEVTTSKLLRSIPAKTPNKIDSNVFTAEVKRSNDILKELPNINNTILEQPKLHSQPKKYGKTPGRERKKNEGSKRPLTRGAAQKGTPLEFASPVVNPSPASPPIWDINKISFSNVVAQNSFKTAAITNNSRIGGSMSPFCNSNGQPSYRFEQEVLDNVCASVDDEVSEISFASNLGPIGTRKSPSSTPVWEPVPCIQKPIPGNVNSNPNSYFSGSFPRYSSSALQDHTNEGAESDLLAGASGLLDNVYGTKRSFDSTLLMGLLQQQHRQTSKLQSLYTNQNDFWGLNLSQREQTWSTGPVRPPPGLKPLHEKNINMTDNSTYNEHQRQQNVLPPFDPFKSLSSIWSNDAWPSNLNNSESNREQM